MSLTWKQMWREWTIKKIICISVKNHESYYIRTACSVHLIILQNLQKYKSDYKLYYFVKQFLYKDPPYVSFSDLNF